MSRFEEASRPVLYEHDHTDFAYWGKGSSFLIANSRDFYWVTAAHVIANVKAHVDSLRIFPSDGSSISLPFNEQYTVSKGVANDEDYKDMVVLRIDLHNFVKSGDAPLIAQDLEAGVLSADALRPSDELWIVVTRPKATLSITNPIRSAIREVCLGASIRVEVPACTATNSAWKRQSR